MASAIAGFLRDDNEWVRLNAAGALASFGRQAEHTITNLVQCLQDARDSKLRERVERTIEEISTAEANTADIKSHQEQLAAIRAWRKTHEQN